MSKIKNGGLDQYSTFEQQQFGTTDVEGVNEQTCDIFFLFCHLSIAASLSVISVISVSIKNF